MPAIAAVESVDEEFVEGAKLAVLLEVEVTVGEDVDVGMERVGVRTALLAVRVKYTGRSRSSHEAGEVTDAAPAELLAVSFLSVLS